MRESSTPGTTPRRGGRPSQSQSGLIREQILDIATDMFLAQGYGATSIEAIAKSAGMAKRTFYHRFADKEELFAAVVHRLILRMRPAHTENLFKGGTLEEILQKLAKAILRAALSPEALALHRMIISETARFPELAAIMDSEGARKQAVTLIAQLLEHYTQEGTLKLDDAWFAAEQFLQMVVSAPQQNALASGDAIAPDKQHAWADKTVRLFLDGCKNRNA